MTYTLQELIQKDQELGRAIFDRDNRRELGVRCENCRYFHGECHKPSPVADAQYMFPRVGFYDWCGDFQRDTTPN